MALRRFAMRRVYVSLGFGVSRPISRLQAPALKRMHKLAAQLELGPSSAPKHGRWPDLGA
jgi:hypothetical protein